jgi:hypothetical protein
MSLQLTLARAEARAADLAWRDHVAHCPPCDRVKARMKGAQCCTRGEILRGFKRHADAVLREERRLEKGSWPGQEAMF